MKLNPIVSNEYDASDVLKKHGITAYQVRMLSVRHMAKIRDAGVMDLPKEVFERARAIDAPGLTDGQKTAAARRDLNAEKKRHPSTGYHEPSVIRYGVVSLNGEPVTPEFWDNGGMDALSHAAARELADSVCRFSGLNESDGERGEG